MAASPHPLSKDDIRALITNMMTRLDETLDSSKYNRGPVNDALKIVIPMMEDNLAICSAILERMEE